MLSVVDLEKLDIPPMLDETKGLYDNSILTVKAVLAELALEDPAARTCSTWAAGAAGSPATSRPRLAARSRATTSTRTRSRTPTTGPERCDMTDRLHFKVDNHHDPLDYPSETFDGCFSFQAVWPFFKKEGLDLHAREMNRVLKPGARYACSEYLLTPFFDWDNEKHVALHWLILPTLAATQSMYPADVCAALERAGFRTVLSAPSKSEAWPLCEQKRDLILWGRRLVRTLEANRVAPAWVEESLDLLQRGGQAWTEAERAEIADLNWRIVAEK